MASSVVELNPQGESSLPARSTERLDIMDSVPVNDSFGDNTTHESVGRCKACNHPFTIRGFVLNMRQREPRLCYPFRLKGSTDLWKELPSMVVPKSKYWRCPVCVPKDEWNVLKDLFGMSSKVAQKRDAATNAAIPLVEKSSKITNTAVGIRITEVSGSTDSMDNKIFSPITIVCADTKGKGKAHVEDDIPPYTGFLNGFLKKSLIQGIQEQTAHYFKASSSAGKDCQTEKGGEISQRLSENNFVEEPSGGATADMPGIVSRHCSQIHQVNLPDLNECSGEPLYEENNENVVIDNQISNFCEDDDDYLGSESRKKPKVRLLSELLGLKETQVPAKARKRNPSSTGSLDENIKWKRVGSQDEGSKRMDIKSSNTRTDKVVGIIKISESESENGHESDNVSTEKISDALAKKRCKSKDLLHEKRNKKIKVGHGEFSMSRQTVKPKSIHDNQKYFDLLRKQDVPAQSSERSSVLTKKRGKVLQARKETPSLVLWKSRMPQQSGATQDKEAEQNATENVQSAFGNAHQVPSGYLRKENDQPCIPMRKGGFSSPSSQAEPVLIDGSSVRNHKENTNVGEISIAFKSSAVGISFTENQSDENGVRSNGIKTNPKENKVGIPEAEGCSPLSQQITLQVPNSVVNHNALTNEVRGRIQDIDINSIPKDDKTNEEGPGDDIPMDIVELMAKNQYERHLDDPKDKQNFRALPAPNGTFIRQDGICGSYGQRLESFFTQPPFLSMQKPLSLDNGNSVVKKCLGPSSDSNSNPLGARGLPRENPVSTRFFSPSQSEEHISPQSSCALAPNSWNGNIHMAGQCLPPSFLQVMDSYIKLKACAPGQNEIEASQVWASSVMASRKTLGITYPQMISQSSNVLNRENIHLKSPGSLFSFSTAATHAGKQQTLNFSNAYDSGHTDSSAGSVDVNDDRIPAWQLLGLGHSDGSDGNSQNTDLSLGPQKTTSLNSSRQPFFKSTGKPSTMQDNYRHPFYPTTLPTSQPFAPSYQNNGASVGMSGASFMGAIPLTSRGQRNMEGSHFAPRGGESQSLRERMAPPLDEGKGVVSMPSLLDKGKGIASMSLPLDKGKGIASMALSLRAVPLDKGTGLASMALSLDKGKGVASMALPLDKEKGLASMSSSLNKGKGIASMPPLSFVNAFRMKGDTSKVQPKAGVRWDKKKFFPASDKQICQLNQNPREFTDLKLAQSFMYGASELRPRAPARERTPRPRGGSKKPESNGSKPGPSGTGRGKQPKKGP